jgi:predicted restriction endonuclease
MMFWFTILDDYHIQLSSKAKNLSNDFGKMDEYGLINKLSTKKEKILLPENAAIYPHKKSLEWHRENIFYP